MMVGVAAQERHAAGHQLFGVNVRDFETEHLRVEGGSALKIGDLQYHVAYFGDMKIHTLGRNHAFKFFDVNLHGNSSRDEQYLKFTLYRRGSAGIILWNFRNSITNSSKPAGSSMLHAWPVLARILWTAPGTSDAVSRPPLSELSYSPLITRVGTFIVPNLDVMSVPPRARKIWPMDSPVSQGSRSTKVLSRYLPNLV